MRNRKYQIWLPILFSVVLISGMYIGYKLSRDRIGAKFFKNEQLSPIDEIMGLVNKDYVDPINMDTFQLKSIHKILGNLDPHSVYITPEEVQDFNETISGNYLGLGLDYQMSQDTAIVLNMFPDGPSAKAGLQKGDRLIAVNNSISLVGKNYTTDTLHHIFKSIKDSKIEVTVLRNNQKKAFTIKKALVPKPSVVASYMLNSNTGYIKITHFSETTYPEFMIALDKLKKTGLQQLVLDLRGNGGGIMQQAIDIVDEFLPDDKLVVYTQGSKRGRVDYKCKRDGLFEKGKIALLVDEESASASEIIAGALQDWDRATIIGRRTFGKGLVQEQYNLSNGGALRLTIARYYTPLGRCIQKSYSAGMKAYESELQQRLENGELEHNDTTKNHGKAYKTPSGKIVYDGGGITPDIFVPYDSAEHPKAVIEMYIHGWISEFALNYYEKNKSKIDSYSSASDMNGKSQTTEQDWNELVQFAQKKGIELNSISATAKASLLENLKADIAKVRWYPDGFYIINNAKDPAIQAALNSLNNSK